NSRANSGRSSGAETGVWSPATREGSPAAGVRSPSSRDPEAPAHAESAMAKDTIAAGMHHPADRKPHRIARQPVVEGPGWSGSLISAGTDHDQAGAPPECLPGADAATRQARPYPAPRYSGAPASRGRAVAPRTPHPE